MGRHLNIILGLRFELPDHLVDRSIIYGSVFTNPGFDQSRNPITYIGQVFLTNVMERTQARTFLFRP